MATPLRLLAGALALAVAAWPARAAAQADDQPTERAVPGWVFTPSIAFGLTYDNNPVLTSDGDPSPNDTVTVVRPRVGLSLRKKHLLFGGSYTGSVLRYATFSEFNAYDQGGRLEFQYQPARRVRLFARESFSVSPTTDTVQVAGVPFFRTGTRHNEATIGVNVAATPLLEVTGTYGFQWLQFDQQNLPFNAFLEGGHAHQVGVDVLRRVSTRVRVGVSYAIQHALVGQLGDTFNVQHVDAVVNWQFAERATLEAGAGVAHIALTNPQQSRTGPSIQATLRKETDRALFSVSVLRSFVPSFGFGGSVRNQEVRGSVRAPLGRRLYTSGQIGWRRAEPVFVKELALTDVFVDAVLGYPVQRWLSLEGFYSSARQDTVVAGGPVHRNRVGFRVVTSHPMRIE